MNNAVRDQLALLPDYLSNHLLLTVTALGIGIGVSLPLSILVTRVRPLRGPVLMFASTMQTIPSIAMLALMVPLLRTIGFLPAAIALTLYSMLPVLRNTVTGIDDVDPNLIEAGRGLGMTPMQLLMRVQIPLAMPVIIAGIRTATVWVVGIATLSTPVGATSLGNYIFSGLQTQNHTAVLIGCFAAAILAIVLDGLIRMIEAAVSRRNRAMLAFATLAVLLVVGAGLAPMVLARGSADDRPRVVVGAKTFTEQYILAEMIAGHLEAADFNTQTLEGLGSTIIFDALSNGRIDCYVDYTGTIWANYMDRETMPGADSVLEQATTWLQKEHGITCVGRFGFENSYALAMRRDRAEELQIETIADLFRHAPEMKIGGDYEFFGRPEWETLRSVYGLEFRDRVGMDGALMYSAVATGELDVIAAFSTDGRIAAYDLLVLEDTRSALPPYDAVLLVSERAAKIPRLLEAMQKLVLTIDGDDMRAANKLVDVDGESVAAAADALHDRAITP